MVWGKIMAFILFLKRTKVIKSIPTNEHIKCKRMIASFQWLEHVSWR